MSSHGATPSEKEQLTVITLAKKSAALRHGPVGKYFYASLKRRPLTGWERRVAARQRKARDVSRVFWTNVASFFFFFLFFFCPALERAQGGTHVLTGDTPALLTFLLLFFVCFVFQTIILMYSLRLTRRW